jgi:hypothetical protein
MMPVRLSPSRHELLLQLDRSGALMNLAMVVISIVGIRHHTTNHINIVPVMLGLFVEAALLILLWCATHSGMYQRHRVPCAVAIQSMQFAANLFFMPLAFDICDPQKLAEGKHVVVAWNHLLSGWASFSIALQALVVRLPLSVAAPVAAAKMVLGWWLLSSNQTKWLSVPAVQAVVLEVKSTLDTAYSNVISVLALASLAQVEPTATSWKCPTLSLTLWFHLCLAGLIPLYCLAVMEYSQQQPQTRTTPGVDTLQSANTASNSAHITESIGESTQQEGVGAAENNSQQLPPNSLVSGHDNPAAVASWDSTWGIGPATEATPQTGALSQQSAGNNEHGRWMASACACMHHSAVLFGASMLIWVAVEAAVELWGTEC